MSLVSVAIQGYSPTQLLAMALVLVEDSVAGEGSPSLSKNKLKKLNRDKEWEAGREARKAKRKEKAKAKKARLRAARDEGNFPQQTGDSTSRNLPKTQVPIQILIDCSFNHLMTDREFVSLSSQITRSYSQNHKAQCRPRVAVCSFGGALKERFEGPLGGQYRSWKHFDFLEDDFQAVSQDCAFGTGGAPSSTTAKSPQPLEANDEGLERAGEIIYLTGDSPETLSELLPHHTYVIGGLVDRNRHKGLCHKVASDKGLRTAKLPIGEYMRMNSRFVLTVNQVLEIMLRWLEFRDWGKAFTEVIPKRKGGTLKDTSIGCHSDTKREIDGDNSEDESLNSDDGKSENGDTTTVSQAKDGL